MSGSQSALTYDTVLWFWRVVVNIFFREIRPRGAWNIPKDGPVIFVAAPHSNQFLDPVLVASEALRESKRRPAFLIAAKSEKRKVIGAFSRLMGSIPVARAADSAKTGSGRIALSPDDPCRVIGYGTKFKTELAPKKQIMLPKSLGSSVAEVVEVISDTEARIKKEFGGESGKTTNKFRERVQEMKNSEGKDGLEYRVLPFIDQGEMYGAVYKRLTEGGSIAIFPEGGSHDRTDLLPLKAGVAIMALGAMAVNPGLRVRIVPVGLSYFHADKFRSRAVVEFGSALDVPPELVDMFKTGGSNKREASGKLLDLIYDGLKTVTVRAPDYETLMVIQAGRRLYKPPGQHVTLGQVVELNKRFIEGYLHFQNEPRIQSLKADVLKYNRDLRDLGLKDHQVPRATRATWKTLGLLVYRLGLLLVWSTFALPGVVLGGPVFITAKLMSRKKQAEALAASDVKIAARDVVATWKVLISLGLAPVLYMFYAFLATVVAFKAGASTKWKILTPICTMIAIPIIAWSALKFGEAGMDVLKSLRPLVISLFPGQQVQLDKIRKERERLAKELSDVINEFGPKLYEDFEEWRILVPTSSAPPSSGQPGLWNRKSGTGSRGGVDGQGHLLTHPITWLDERIWGWTRSARRGTNVWAGPKSTEASRMHSPDASDEESEEETGDYDDVLGNIPGYVSPSNRLRSRSLANSYADLQQLKRSTEQRKHLHPEDHHLAPIKVPVDSSASVSPTSTTHPDGDGQPPSPSSPRRERRNSLEGNVHVGRLAVLDQEEPFKECTEDINRETQIRRRQTLPVNGQATSDTK
ncbi:hypothetical protein M407DRAFT_240595 [Tulasnella calospora MUT 4182]|uniref:Phospholipid/glycerol acyltransferase domain-containing protein n=1 Tax=Tulasnella calospora MUT 4182 TaxID=1051891 RepID=A0A0C3LL31_9AGAM|nr:hypothetical protein M407DRAFT_240595 [Tulasnella calospora MUT 4182]